MVLTLQDLKDRLSKLEETYLIELLGVSSEDIVEIFSELIEWDFHRLEAELEEGFDVRALGEDEEEGESEGH